MTPTPATRRATPLAAAALVALVGLVSFVAFSSMVGSPTATGSSATSGASRPRLQVSGSHPDFVGVADHRPPSGSALVVTGPIVLVALGAGLVAIGTAVLAAHAGADAARLRRWRARLVGAPPLVA